MDGRVPSGVVYHDFHWLIYGLEFCSDCPVCNPAMRTIDAGWDEPANQQEVRRC